jgi:hypothetical protein
MSHDSVHLFFVFAALKDIDVLACHTQNAYINTEMIEKVWFCGGDKMSTDKGKIIVIIRVVYGLKSSGARWREHMAQTLCNIRFQSCKAERHLVEGNSQSRRDEHI